jgi:dephospho-CoA kinase
MKIIGLTGSIGMGKSTLANQWRSIGVPVHDADACVHDLMTPNGDAFDAIMTAFPDVIVNKQIDRKVLGKLVFNDPEKRKILENIIHPLVRTRSDKFISLCRKRRVPVCVLDIPLLFETGRDVVMDTVICVSAPSWVQKRRVLARPNMTPEKFKSIVSAQISDYRKRVASDHVIISARGKRHTLNAIKKIKNNER